MDVITPVIGIPKWNWKKLAVEYALRHPRVFNIPIKDFCYECERHFDILAMFEVGSSHQYSSSKYYLYHKKQGRDHDSIMRRVKKFHKLYRSVIKKGCLEPPIVTCDGCRLNGSHRLAILIHRKEEKANINVVSYENFRDRKASKIRRQVQEYRSRVYGL